MPITLMEGGSEVAVLRVAADGGEPSVVCLINKGGCFCRQTPPPSPPHLATAPTHECHVRMLGNSNDGHLRVFVAGERRVWNAQSGLGEGGGFSKTSFTGLIWPTISFHFWVRGVFAFLLQPVDRVSLAFHCGSDVNRGDWPLPPPHLPRSQLPDYI